MSSRFWLSLLLLEKMSGSQSFGWRQRGFDAGILDRAGGFFFIFFQFFCALSEMSQTFGLFSSSLNIWLLCIAGLGGIWRGEARNSMALVW